MAEARDAIAAFQKASTSAQGTFANADKRIEELKPALKEVPKAVASISRAADKAGKLYGDVKDKVAELGSQPGYSGDGGQNDYSSQSGQSTYRH